MFKVIDHPLIQHKLTVLRDENTGTQKFRNLVEEMTMLVAYEATRDLPTEQIEVQTPVDKYIGGKIVGKKIAIIPILRAGLGMVGGITNLIPSAKIGHVGLYRNEETLEPVEYYAKCPNDLDQRDVFILDPMLATGGTAAATVEILKSKGAKEDRISLICIVAAPEGRDVLTAACPKMNIYACALDERLNENGYIVPGLGDAGDRLFGTK